MRGRLIEAAVHVFAEKGVDASVVDDVIRVAEVSRGTFYKYFQSNHELLVAAAEGLGNEMLLLVEANVLNIADPVERIAQGLISFVSITQRYPLVARFAYRVGFEAVGPTSLIYEYLPPHIEEAISTGAFRDEPRMAMLDMIIGAILACIARISMEPPEPEHISRVVLLVLCGLGVPYEQALSYSLMQPGHFKSSSDSLMERTHKVALLQSMKSGNE